MTSPRAPVRHESPVASDIHFANGIALTPEDRTLIVAESYARRLTAEWRGPEATFAGDPTGQVLSAPAPAPAAGGP